MPKSASVSDISAHEQERRLAAALTKETVDERKPRYRKPDKKEIIFDQLSQTELSQYRELWKLDISQLFPLRQRIDTELERLSEPSETMQQDVKASLEKTKHEILKVGARLQHFKPVSATIENVLMSLVQAAEAGVQRIDNSILVINSQAVPRGKKYYSELKRVVKIDDAPDLATKSPQLLLASFIGLVMSIFAGISEHWAKSFYVMMQYLLVDLMKGPYHDRKGAEEFPTTLSTHKKIFGLDAKLITYATCPECCKTFKANEKGIYPFRCDWKEYDGGKECGAKLCKERQGKDGKSHLVPRRPFVMQDFRDFKARLLRMPGVEALLEEGMMLCQREHMEHITDGSWLKDLKDPENRPFLTRLKQPELRLVWAYSLDHFSRGGNRIAKRRYSNGMQAFVCMQLPPSMAHQPEYIFLAAIDPGPNEPKGAQINHFMEPVLMQFEESYQHGDYFEKTFKYPNGRTERSMIGIIISDSVAAKQISGFRHYTAKSNFCNYDHQQGSDLWNIEVESWQRRTLQETKKAALAWRDAKTATDRKEIYEKMGMRWTALWKLSYYNPTEMLVVDGMHNLFLHVVYYHFVTILGFHEDHVKKEKSRDIMAKELAQAEKWFTEKASLKKLKCIRIPILNWMLKTRGINIPGKMTKETLIPLLQREFCSPAVEIQASSSSDLVMVGEGILKELAGASNKPSLKITKGELTILRQYYTKVECPSHHERPPAAIGAKSEGSLKAAQWRAAIEFDYILGYLKLCYLGQKTPLEEDSDKGRLLRATVHLACAVRFATSEVISQWHADKCLEHLKAYLQLLKDLNVPFVPNHHFSLHLPEMLMKYGPMRGWWMFPFERVIHILETTNMNGKPGETEGTMMRSFYAVAGLRALLFGENCPRVLAQCRDTILGAIERTPMRLQEHVEKASDISQPLREVMLRTVVALTNEVEGWSLPMKGIFKESLTIGGITFSVRSKTNKKRNSNVLYRPLGQQSMGLIPGNIENIITVNITCTQDRKEQSVDLLFIRPLCTADIKTSLNPFIRYPDLGASIWSAESSDDLDVITAWMPLRHFASIPWTKGTLVIKDMSRSVDITTLK